VGAITDDRAKFSTAGIMDFTVENAFMIGAVVSEIRGDGTST